MATKEEFFKDLQEVAGRFDWAGGALRGIEKVNYPNCYAQSSPSFCPITAVCYAKGKGYCSAESYLWAGFQLGLSESDTEEIVLAADYCGRPSTRKKLLEAAGLT